MVLPAPTQRRRCAIDPLDEDGHAEVVALLGRLGRTAEARAHYEQARRILVGELGRRSVSVKLEQARRSLGATVEAVAAPQSLPGPSVRASEAFVGRLEERVALQRLVETARAGAAECAAIVVGEPGIGKSRLLDELARLVATAGGTVLRGRGFEPSSCGRTVRGSMRFARRGSRTKRCGMPTIGRACSMR